MELLPHAKDTRGHCNSPFVQYDDDDNEDEKASNTTAEQLIKTK